MERNAGEIPLPIHFCAAAIARSEKLCHALSICCDLYFRLLRLLQSNPAFCKACCHLLCVLSAECNAAMFRAAMYRTAAQLLQALFFGAECHSTTAGEIVPPKIQGCHTVHEIFTGIPQCFINLLQIQFQRRFFLCTDFQHMLLRCIPIGFRFLRQLIFHHHMHIGAVKCKRTDSGNALFLRRIEHRFFHKLHAIC